MAYYLFNFDGDPDEARTLLRAKRWPVAADEEHGASLDAGDVALVYVSADRVFIARAELGSGVGDTGEVSFADVEWWDPPASMDVVLAAMDPSEKAKGAFDTGVLRITDGEYGTAVAVGRRGGAG